MEVTMRNACTIVTAALAAGLVAPSDGWSLGYPDGLQDRGFPSLVFEQRRDVEEVSLPPPPSGPATPVPFCTPAQPTCP
jgi:hypothetical protein